jgi:hypothetical protein
MRLHGDIDAILMARVHTVFDRAAHLAEWAILLPNALN